MEEQDLQELLDAIVWAHRIVEVGDETFVFRPLTLEERNMANYVYNSTLRKSKLGRRDQLKAKAIKGGLWLASNEKDLELLRTELAKLLDDMSDEEKANKHRRNPTSKLKRLRSRIASITTTIREIEDNHARYIELPSAEYSAECERGIFCLRCATLDFPEMNQHWPVLNDLKNEEDRELVSSLLHQFYNLQIASEKDIRALARSGYWRSKWNGSKKNRGVKTLFNKEMYDLTIDQYHLMFWSQIYDSAFESMEPPSDKIVEDDKLFDKWLEEQHEKRKQERAKSDMESKHKSKKGQDAQELAFSTDGFYSQECTCGVKEAAEARGERLMGHAHDPSCPYGVFVYYDKETRAKKVEEIQSTNPANVRKLLAKEQARLAERGTDGIEEQELRGDKARQLLGMGTKIHGPGEYGKVNKGRARPQ